MKLVIASNNGHKITEIKAILTGCFEQIVSLKEAGVYIDVIEDGLTFEENALKKAREVLKACNADAALSDDSGLMVDYLNGAPGVYSARFAGEGHDDEANNHKLLALMQGVPYEKRTCRFVSSVALVNRSGEEHVCTGYVEGKLLTSPAGDNGFGYDPLFYYEPYNASFAQLSADEKNQISHRKNALQALREKLKVNP